VIAGKAVDYRAGISREQAVQLLDQDLAPARKEVERLVTVELTKNQEDALTSFVFNVGGAALKRSEWLKKLNAGRYDEVPQELMGFVRAAGGQVLPGLVARRRSEVALWNKH
jgi:lysozyme